MINVPDREVFVVVVVIVVVVIVVVVLCPHSIIIGPCSIKKF